MLYIHITCKRGSAAVIRTTCCSCGKGKFCSSPELKLLYQSAANFERLITSVRQRELPNLVAIGSKGASPHVGEIYTFLVVVCVFSSCFFDQATDHNSQRILMYCGSKQFVWRKDVPFEYPKC